MIRRTARVAFKLATRAVLVFAAACTDRRSPSLSEVPSVRFQSDSTKPHFGDVIVAPIDGRTLAPLKDLDAASWQKILVVHAEDTTGLPMLGRYIIESNQLRFEPAYPPVRGTKYTARMSGDALNAALHRTGPGWGSNAIWMREFPSGTPTTVVSAIYPTIDSVPMNLLRMYIQFSAPMTVGDSAEGHVRLVDEQGKTVDKAFLVAAGGQELWDPAHTRMTIFFDPGRIKRDLKPHEALGLPLQTGHRYRLVVDSLLHDARGLVLAHSYVKQFTVGPVDRDMPATKLWHVSAPASGGRDPLLIDLREPLDHALLSRMLRVVDGKNTPIGGESATSKNDRRWTFTPTEPWQPGSYSIEVDTELEDLAGNNLRRPFDVMPGDSPSRGNEQSRVRLAFTISAHP